MEQLSYKRNQVYGNVELFYDSINSSVYKATDLNLNRKVCIKAIKFEDKADSVKNEVKVLVNFENSCLNLPTIYDYFEQDKTAYIVMEWVSGDSLEKLLSYKMIDELQMLNYMIEVCGVLAKLEKSRLYHRDIKPANIMIDKHGQVKLIDFGISTHLANMVEGTIGYRAPEMALNSKYASRNKVDMFAIGVMLYEFYKGSIPTNVKDYKKSVFSSDNQWEVFVEPKQYNQNISYNMNQLIIKCMKYDPKERFKNNDELLRSLKSLRRELRHGRK